jgi:hypothetical protein
MRAGRAPQKRRSAERQREGHACTGSRKLLGGGLQEAFLDKARLFGVTVPYRTGGGVGVRAFVS